jgi:predicted lipid-binding transport protein (Tim44 family)
VVRGPVINRIRIIALDAAADPATMNIEVDLSGRRYVENRDTTEVVSGSRTRKTNFTERWTMSLSGPDEQPWQISSATGARSLSW